MVTVMERWQSGNAADSKSAEPMLNWRAGSNPVRSLKYSVEPLILRHYQYKKSHFTRIGHLVFSLSGFFDRDLFFHQKRQHPRTTKLSS
jgi:hypothetical protein